MCSWAAVGHFVSPRRRQIGGFTLIELLVVISIIALLVGILMPSLITARQAAWRSTCLSNLRNCNTALNLYTGEHEGYFPGNSVVTPSNPTGSPSRVVWLGKAGTGKGQSEAVQNFLGELTIEKRFVNPYLPGGDQTEGEMPMVKCPLDGRKGEDGMYQIHGSSYTGNCEWEYYPSLAEFTGIATQGSNGISIETVARPALMVAFAEEGAVGAALGLQGTQLDKFVGHGDGVRYKWNIAFLDGHADTVDITPEASGNARWSGPDYTFENR